MDGRQVRCYVCRDYFTIPTGREQDYAVFEKQLRLASQPEPVAMCDNCTDRLIAIARKGENKC